MVRPDMVFTLVVREVFLAGVPTELVHPLGHFVTDPKEPHFHRARALAFDGIIGNAHGRGIITMHWGLWLGVAHVGQGEAKNNAGLAIVVQCPQLSLCSRCNDESKDSRADMEGPIKPNGVTIAWLPPHEEVSTCAAACLSLGKI
jgi:hypothetical protein